MTEHYLWELSGAIIGGIISGLAGITVAWYTLRNRTKDETKQMVYIPLYESIMNIELEPIFDGYADDKWERLGHYQKLKAETTIKQLYGKYETLRKKHHGVLIEWDNEWHTEAKHFTTLMKPLFISLGYPEEKIPLKLTYLVNLDTFLNWFRHILFNNTIKTSDELYEKLLEYSHHRQPDFENWLKQLHTEHPEFFVKLFSILRKIDQTFPTHSDYSEIIKRRDELKQLIIQIKRELKTRV